MKCAAIRHVRSKKQPITTKLCIASLYGRRRRKQRPLAYVEKS